MSSFKRYVDYLCKNWQAWLYIVLSPAGELYITFLISLTFPGAKSSRQSVKDLASDPNITLFTLDLDLEVISFLIVSILLIKKSLKSWGRTADSLPHRKHSFEPSKNVLLSWIFSGSRWHDAVFSVSLIGLVLTFCLHWHNESGRCHDQFLVLFCDISVPIYAEHVLHHEGLNCTRSMYEFVGLTSIVFVRFGACFEQAMIARCYMQWPIHQRYWNIMNLWDLWNSISLLKESTSIERSFVKETVINKNNASTLWIQYNT